MKWLHGIALASLGVAVAVFGLKWQAANLTGSLAMQANAAEKLLNIATALLVLLSLLLRRNAARPAAAERAVALLLAALILYAGLSLMRQALAGGTAGAAFDPAGLMVSLLATVFNGAWGMVLVRTGQRHAAPAMVADGRHLQADVLGSLVVVVAAATQLPWLDRSMALIAGGLLVVRAAAVARAAFADPCTGQKLSGAGHSTITPAAGTKAFRSEYRHGTIKPFPQA